MPKIKDIPKVERPREKLLQKGANALSKTDLLAILIGSGIKGINVQTLAKTIITKFNQDFLNITIDDLLKIKGIGQAKALQIYSAVALIKRFYQEQNNTDLIIDNVQNVLTLAFNIRDKKKEHLICLHLDSRNALIKKETLSIGLLDKSLIHPREIFSSALENKAANIILIHNHPSGDPRPSQQDEKIAKKISQAGQIMGVALLDFVIIAKGGHNSFYQALKHDKNLDYVADGFQMGIFDHFEETPVYESEYKFTFIDLFAGIGGFHLAASNLGGKCVFASEFDENARKTYETNFLSHNKDLFYSGNFAGDITKVDEKEIPDFDFLFAGFPCQPFSIAGYRQGFDDKSGRGNLFFDITRILKEKQPKAFILENVKNLKTHDEGNTIKVIYNELQKLGYKVTDCVLNAMEYGNTPQNRERIFIVGFLEQNSFNNFKFPEKIKLKKTIHSCLEKTAKERYYYNDKPLYEKLKNDVIKKDTVYQWRRKYVRENKSNVCSTLTTSISMGGDNTPIVKMAA
ncbi:DNA-cytosine methyltransferase [uncultured Candidatus Thioglobus sp.]|nr:DNA-cytosine methyltransferase [uncultured Candidatus Thioglobus sp.]